MTFRGTKSIYSAFTLPAKNAGLKYDIIALVDPASRDAQRLSQILLVLQRSLPCNITVILNPVNGLSDLPLKKFVRCLPMGTMGHFYLLLDLSFS